MTRRLFLTLLLPAVLLSLAPSQPRPERVAFVGDSHMEALGPMMTRTFRDEGYEPVGFIARRGWGTRRYQLADDLTRELRPMRPDVVVVQLGNNDYGVGSTRRYRPRVQWVVRAIRRAGAEHILWLGPSAANPEANETAERVAENHERIAELQRQMMFVLPRIDRVRWMDSRPFTREHLRSDGVHLTRQGYEEWALAAAVQR